MKGEKALHVAFHVLCKYGLGKEKSLMAFLVNA